MLILRYAAELLEARDVTTTPTLDLQKGIFLLDGGDLPVKQAKI